VNERYRVYSTYLKETYGEKVYKLPISIPDTCPNRDGTLGVRGCAFCGSIGAGYENLPATVTIGQQIEQNMAHIKPKYKANKFIAYFQNFTNTYLPPERFRDYLAAACQPDIVALAVATRPDCLNETYLDIMADVKERYGVDILVELGLQTVNYKTLAIPLPNTSTPWSCSGSILSGPVRMSSSTCPGIPWKTPSRQPRSLPPSALTKSSSTPCTSLRTRPWPNGMPRERSSSGPAKSTSVVAFLEYSRPDTVFQRLIGRAPKEATDFANWGMGWWRIRDMIDEELEKRGTCQGARCDYLHGKAVRKFMK